MLVHLDLSSSGITYIGKEAFTGIDQLRAVLLNNNSLNVNTLPPTVFSKLNLLQQLAVHDNYLSPDVVTYNDQLYAKLRNLKKLSLDGLPNATFGQGFSCLNSLQSLRIYGGVEAHNKQNV